MAPDLVFFIIFTTVSVVIFRDSPPEGYVVVTILPLVIYRRVELRRKERSICRHKVADTMILKLDELIQVLLDKLALTGQDEVLAVNIPALLQNGIDALLVFCGCQLLRFEKIIYRLCECPQYISVQVNLTQFSIEEFRSRR